MTERHMVELDDLLPIAQGVASEKTIKAVTTAAAMAVGAIANSDERGMVLTVLADHEQEPYRLIRLSLVLDMIYTYSILATAHQQMAEAILSDDEDLIAQARTELVMAREAEGSN